jgi:mRNA-degrading endonuclease RelE of RelBE toxin-antitoxin system
MAAVRLPKICTICREKGNWIDGPEAAFSDRPNPQPAISGAKPLRGDLAGHYRMRTGDYRLQFRVAKDEIVIEKVGHRDRFYED